MGGSVRFGPHSLPIPAIYRLQKVPSRGNPITPQSHVKEDQVMLQIRIEEKIFNEDCRDKSRGRVTTNHRNFFFNLRE